MTESMNFIFILIFLSKFALYSVNANEIACNCGDCSDWIITSNQYPKDPRLRPGIANGHIGTRVYDPSFHVNGFYFGYLWNSTRVKVPNPIAFWAEIDAKNSQLIRNYTLNTQTGIFMETIWDTVRGINVTIEMYANMADKHFLVTEITIKSKIALDENFTIKLRSLTLNKTDDMNVQSVNDTGIFTVFKAEPVEMETDNVTVPNLTLISTNLPPNLTFFAGEISHKWIFYAVVTMNDGDLATELFEKGQDLMKIQDGKTGFMNAHVEEWWKIWQSRFDVVGNCDLAQRIHANFYHILSSMPISSNYSNDGYPFFGISPGSLANDDLDSYNGHVFWDQDLWMLLGLLPLYPGVVKKTLLDSRVRHLGAAKDNAKRFGFDGATFPWEAAYSGYETTNWPPAELYEVHVTGNTALSAKQYLQFTGDFDFAQKFYETSQEIAKYWRSRLQSVSEDGNTLGIYNVMGPDEYHYPINNSIYTNSVAQLSLRLPKFIYNTFNVTGDVPESNWTDAANKIYMLFDKVHNYHPEYEGYPFGELIKQADVILLGYPLMVKMDAIVRKNDLLIYQSVTSANGPAMTWAMHSIGWLELGEEELAATLFRRNFDYMRGPYHIWTETAQGLGAENFVTGIGGFMQNLLQGYLGIRIYENRLEFFPHLLPKTEKYSAIGVKYQGMSLNFVVDISKFQLQVKNATKTDCVLIVEFGKRIKLKTGLTFLGRIKEKKIITCQPESFKTTKTKKSETAGEKRF